MVLHVTEIFGTTLEENLRMIRDSVAYLRSQGREVLYDAEHFFDGFKRNPDYALKSVQAAQEAGADYLTLCDTNGGTLPQELAEIINQVKASLHRPLGIHVHNDGGLAVANTLAAVAQGITMVQGTINGYGERCGNADLITVIGNLQLKLGYHCLPPENLAQLKEVSRYVSDLANLPPTNDQPFVGKSAFAHKGGVHVSAVLKNPVAYEHINPDMVGARRRVLVSDLSGKSNIRFKAEELGMRLGQNGADSQKIVKTIKALEDEGYQFDAAEGSFELLVKKLTGQFKEPFTLESLRVIIEKGVMCQGLTQATIKVSVGPDEEITAAEGDGPVNAMDNALRKALHKFFPKLEEVRLVDFKVRVVEGTEGTGARVKVLIESADHEQNWSTMGVSENIIEASWLALVDSLQYKLCQDQEKMRRTQAQV
ncbi:MAG: citramalate synthase [Deltaproteobacteria bacterium]|nr:citramalate synthase [Deltaproteobacteria bacterium]